MTSAAPHPDLRICVVLPVRNEAAGLLAALSALAAQTSLRGQAISPTQYEVLLLANNCDDHSAALARAFAAHHPHMRLHVAEVTLPPAWANIGHVRGLLMDQAAQRLGSTGHADAWIASTDGDTVVAPDWLARNEHALAAGAHAVGGRIRIHPAGPVDACTLRCLRLDAALRLARSRLEARLDPDPADPWPRHHQHFGASLAITRHAYLQVGGLPRVRYLEDQALVDALRRHDLRLRHSPDVTVYTSSRQDGRAEVGLAWQLRQWAQHVLAEPSMWIEPADCWLQRVLARRELRTLWRRSTGQGGGRPPPVHDLARRLGVAPAWLTSQTASAPFFGTLWAGVQARREPGTAMVNMSVREAIHQMRSLAAMHTADRSMQL